MELEEALPLAARLKHDLVFTMQPMGDVAAGKHVCCGSIGPTGTHRPRGAVEVKAS